MTARTANGRAAQARCLELREGLDVADKALAELDHLAEDPAYLAQLAAEHPEGIATIETLLDNADEVIGALNELAVALQVRLGPFVARSKRLRAALKEIANR